MAADVRLPIVVAAACVAGAVLAVRLHRRISASLASRPSPPNELICPIGGAIMLDPVLCGCSAACGETFHRKNITVRLGVC